MECKYYEEFTMGDPAVTVKACNLRTIRTDTSERYVPCIYIDNPTDCANCIYIKTTIYPPFAQQPKNYTSLWILLALVCTSGFAVSLWYMIEVLKAF